MEDNRLPDEAIRHKCPTCPDYQWLVRGEFHCHRCNPHCEQIGHTDPDHVKCERARCHLRTEG